MKLLKEYIPFHLLINVIFGILLQFYLKIWSYKILYLIGLLIVLLVVTLIIRDKLKKIFNFLSIILSIGIGITVTHLNNSKNNNNYFEYLTKEQSCKTIEITNILNSSTFNDQYIGNVVQVDNSKTTGKILIYIKKNTLKKTLEVGDRILTRLQFKTVNTNKNPTNFNYKDYLAKKDIYKTLRLNSTNFKNLNRPKPSLFRTAQTIRKKIKYSLIEQQLNKETLAITNALLLGDKNLISKETRTNYINAGIIHILAISGLHIGILLYLLTIILRPLNNIKYGKYIKIVLLVISLWTFAFISGLSSSVIRAVSMFSFVCLGQLIHRKVHVEFSLITSMLILTLINPLYIFDVGFQMSYIAVFGIVWINPILLKLWRPDNSLLLFLWNIITVSSAAQIAILPLSLYYFHQFSGLFLLSNLIILPGLTFIIGYGILVIISACLNIKISLIYQGFETLIKLLNSTISYLSTFEEFIIKEIQLTLPQMLSWYLLLIITYKLITNFKIKYTIIVLISLIIIQICHLTEKITIENQEELIVFHQLKKSTIGITKKRSLNLLTNNTDLTKIKDYKTSKGITSIKVDTMKNVFKFRNETFFVVDSLANYQVSKLKKAIVIIRNNPKINLNRLIKVIQPKKIIADGSNYSRNISRWKATCKTKNIHFHSTYENGYYIYK